MLGLVFSDPRILNPDPEANADGVPENRMIALLKPFPCRQVADLRLILAVFDVKGV